MAVSLKPTTLKEQIMTGQNTAHNLAKILERAEVVWVDKLFVILDSRELISLDAFIQSVARVDRYYSEHVDELSLEERLYGMACRAQLKLFVMTSPQRRDPLHDCIMGELLHLFSCCLFPDLGSDLLSTVKLGPESFCYLHKDPISFLTFRDGAGYPYSVSVQELLRRANERVSVEELGDELEAAIEACSKAEIAARELFSSII